MKFAYIIKGDFDMLEDQAFIKNGFAQILGVSTTQQACEVSKKLVLEGVTCIELCGGFSESDVREVIEATDNKTPIGFVTHLKEQDELYKSVFGSN